MTSEKVTKCFNIQQDQKDMELIQFCSEAVSLE